MHKIAVERLDISVHQGYLRWFHPKIPLHPREIELDQARRERKEQVYSDSHWAMIYISTIKTRSLGKVLAFPNQGKNPIETLDALRIINYKKYLGPRMIIYGREGNQGLWSDQFRRDAEARGWRFDQQKLEVATFGEIFELCVRSYDQEIKNGLGLHSPEQDTRVRDLSLTLAETRAIYDVDVA